MVAENYRAVVRIALLDEDVSVKTRHLADTEYADSAERAGADGEYLALSGVRLKLGVGGRMQTEECDVARLDVALESAAGDVRLFIRLESAVHYLLIFHHGAVEYAVRAVAAVEAHEGVALGVAELALDVLAVDVGGNGVVDVEQGNDLVGNALANVLAERAVNINFAGNGNAARAESAVYIAGHEAELCLERGPAFVGESDIFAVALVLFRPVEQGDLVLRELGENASHLVALAKLSGHFGDNGRYALVARVLVVSGEKVKLRVFLDLNAEVVKACYRRVAGKKILRTRAESDEFQISQTRDSARNGDKSGDHIGDLGGSAYGVLGNISANAAKFEVVGSVEHTAESIAAVVSKLSAAFVLSGGGEHHGAAEVLSEQRFGRFRAKVAEVNGESAALSGVDVVERPAHILFVFNDNGTFVELSGVVLFTESGGNGAAAVFRERHREAVAGNCHERDLYLGHI